MLVKADDDDDITILSITPVGADSKNVTFAAEDYNDDAKDSVYTSTNGRGTISVFESGSSTKTKEYKIDLESIEKNFYVNGYPVTVSDLKTTMDTYVTKNAVTGKVTLVDSPDAGKSSTRRYLISSRFLYYVDAVVSSVEGDDEDWHNLLRHTAVYLLTAPSKHAIQQTTSCTIHSRWLTAQ